MKTEKIKAMTYFVASIYPDGTYLVTDSTACTAGQRDYPELRFDHVSMDWIKSNLEGKIVGLNFEFPAKIKSMQELQDELFLENTTNMIHALETSISLSKNEKKKVLLSIPDLSQYQISGLIKIFEDEKKEYERIKDNPEFSERIKMLTEKAKKDWQELSA